MTLPMRYSVQKSNIAPPDFTGEYGRMQVDYRPELEAIVIPASDYDKITTAIAEGSKQVAHTRIAFSSITRVISGVIKAETTSA